MMNGFEFKGVSKKYGDHYALSDVSFSIEHRDRLAIIGPSGCGKSTVLRLLTGLESPTRGEIELDNKTISKKNEIVVSPHKRQIAMVFQDLALWTNLSVLDNVLLGLAAQPMTKKEKIERSINALSLCKIAELSRRKPHTLSGGQQQRVALARALAVEPRFLFLDEPFSGLDLLTKRKLLEDIANLVDQKKMTLILVSHDLMEAFKLCQTALVLNQGVVEEYSSLTDILHNPKSLILKTFKAQLEEVPI